MGCGAEPRGENFAEAYTYGCARENEVLYSYLLSILVSIFLPSTHPCIPNSPAVASPPFQSMPFDKVRLGEVISLKK